MSVGITPGSSTAGTGRTGERWHLVQSRAPLEQGIAAWWKFRKAAQGLPHKVWVVLWGWTRRE